MTARDTFLNRSLKTLLKQKRRKALILLHYGELLNMKTLPETLLKQAKTLPAILLYYTINCYLKCSVIFYNGRFELLRNVAALVTVFKP